MLDKLMTMPERYHSLLERNGINTPLRKAHFFSQVMHESGLKPIAENLNYSKDGLLKTFGKYFNVKQADLYARQPVIIANKVYANRMGNGTEQSGDGWKYRGRGFIQITGKENYRQLSEDTGINFIDFPDALLTEVNSMVSALWYWNKHKLNLLADKDDLKGITRAINGGYNGLSERGELLASCKKLFR